MKLSLVIPLRDDPAGLVRLLIQAQELAWVGEIIVVDDGSDPPAGPGMAGLPQAVAEDARLIWLRSDAGLGAGHARNLGLDRASCDHLIFFDSDDLFLPAMTDILEGLAGRQFDFCLFRHIDSRMRALGRDEGLEGDEHFWRMVQTGVAPAPLPADLAPELVRIAAYPWNKIYRTAFLRENAIRCTEIAVHNDLELHWISFLRARRILVSRAPGCEHVVDPAGTRLTNRRGPARLQVFRALDAVQAALQALPRGADFALAFLDFTLRLCDWIPANLDPEFHAEFAARARAHLWQHLPHPRFARLARQDPALAARVLPWLRGDAA